MKAPINKVSYLIDHLLHHQKKGHLQEFDFENDNAWDILSNKTEKQIKFIFALLIKSNYFKLREVLKKWDLTKK